MTGLQHVPSETFRESCIPVLETARLVLRAPRLGDAKAITALANDRQIAENTARIPHPYSASDAEQFVASANRQDGESYGAELTAAYVVTSGWRVRAGYTELRVHIWPNPGSTDTSRGLTESQSPDRQFFLHSSLDLTAHLGFDAGLRGVGEIARRQVPAYTELNARLTWQPMAKLDLSIVGQNLLHRRHTEFGAPGATRREIERGVYGMVEWRF